MATKRNTGSVWSSISDEEKFRLLNKYESGEPISVPGIKLDTLKRYLRKFRAEVNGGGNNQEQVKIDVGDENHTVLTAKNSKIHTLDQLLSYCEVDLGIWEVERWVTNSWTTPRKQTYKDLTWSNGSIIDGYIEDTGKMSFFNNIQVKAWLVRKEPIPLFPVLKPVIFNLSPFDYEKDVYGWGDKGLLLDLIIPDVHITYKKDLYNGKLFPCHDRKVLDLLLQIAQSYRFNRIIFLGDLLDLTGWSDKFLREPEFEHTTQPAIVEGAWWLSKFRQACPEAEMVVIEGNHEKRLPDKIIRHVSEGYRLKAAHALNLPPLWSIPNLLGFHTMDIQWVDGYPDNKFWINPKLYAEHGKTYSSIPGQTASRKVQKSDVSSVAGHNHKLEKAWRKIQGTNRYISTSCCGLAGKIDGSIPGSNEDDWWQNGFGIVNYREDGKHFVELMPIEEGEMILDTMFWNYRDNVVERLIEDTNGEYNY